MPPPLLNKLSQLDQYLAELRQWLDEYPEGKWSGAMERVLERMVQLIVECTADAGDLWLANRGHPVGETATGVFRELRAAGVMDEAMYGRFRGYVSARNRIVHDYDQITPVEVRRDAEGLARDGAELLRRLLADTPSKETSC
jgi:uncharacterized protein YutE (UPF0331/DUF86 family)